MLYVLYTPNSGEGQLDDITLSKVVVFVKSCAKIQIWRQCWLKTVTGLAFFRSLSHRKFSSVIGTAVSAVSATVIHMAGCICVSVSCPV